ncbi:MAG: chorismate synthase [Lachnospiraceae bacterium]|nr:chorismate synthase [Lachnospiraceae bacterium]
MKNTFGNSIAVTLFGESHGKAIGAVIDGLAPGIDVDEEKIKMYLSRRRPSMATDTPRKEPDDFRIVSGVFKGKTCGTPVTIIIPNADLRSKDYEYGPARPSHADFAAHAKYHGFEDYRGGGHFSGRITAAVVAAGGILLPALEKKGILIGTHIARCKDICDRAFDDHEKDIASLQTKMFPVLDDEAGEKIYETIVAAGEDRDSIGGITETAVTGLEAGLGEPWFDSVESRISHAVFGIGAVKGIEFGAGFEMALKRGSEVNDQIRVEDGRYHTLTNNNGGINGGITNGMPVTFRCAVKPTPTIARPQQTVNFITGENIEMTAKGRHDPAIIRRICPVIDSITAIVISDMLCTRYGTDWLA